MYASADFATKVSSTLDWTQRNGHLPPRGLELAFAVPGEISPLSLAFGPGPGEGQAFLPLLPNAQPPEDV